MRGNYRKYRFLTVLALTACFAFAFGACDKGDESMSSYGDSSVEEQSTESCEDSSVEEQSAESYEDTSVEEPSSKSDEDTSVEIQTKGIYYETQVCFYVEPKEPNGLNTDGNQYGVYGMYGQHVMDNMVKLLNAESFTARLLTFFCDVPTVETDSAYLEQIQKALQFSYEMQIVEEAGLLATGVIYANISVDEELGEEFANDLYTAVIETVPEYIEENMAVPSGYTGTSCQRVSRNDTPQRVEK